MNKTLTILTGLAIVLAPNGTSRFTGTPTHLQAAIDAEQNIVASDAAPTDQTAVAVSQGNSPAVARDSTATTNEDNAVTANLQGYDPDQDPVTYAIISGPSNGDVTLFVPATGALTYEPDPNFNGDDSVSFTITDGILPPDNGVLRIIVTPVNDPPVAQDVALVVPKNTMTHANKMPVTDADEDEYLVSHETGPFHGNVTGFFALTGSFNYTPDLDYVGPDSIQYLADDGVPTAKSASAPSNLGTVRISVVGPCDCPCIYDPNCDGISVDVLDVVAEVARAFRSENGIKDPACPNERTDLNASGSTDILDVVASVNVAFRSGSVAANFVDPCL